MPGPDIYGLCCRYQGRNVRVKCRDGRVHVGHITRVTRDAVWLRPIGHHGGFGYGWFGGFGYGYPIALGFITGVALASAFWW